MEVDWCMDGKDAAAASALRIEISEYLRRHADPACDVAAAEVVVSELLANVVRHAPGMAWVTLTWGEDAPVLEVRDLGPGFTLERVALPPPDQIGGRGLFIATAMVRSLEAAAREAGGTAVRAVLDLKRPPSPSYDPAPSTPSPLPALEEASPGGGFGKEPFLRALIVQLAQAVERTGGPALAEAAVAQVGIDVGGQMEAEYRRAAEVVGRLSPDRLAECFVRLKHAIDGDFFVVEVTDERIVLGARTCPFGEVVRHAPALCRMTSAVFGGIAAGSHGEAAVTLEERIAVGDRECRVVIHLGPGTAEAGATSHRYVAHRPLAD